MLTNSLDSFLFYINHFELVDYGVYIWFIFLTFLFLIFSIMLLQKYTILGLIILFTTIAIMVAGPFTIKWYLNGSLRANETKITLIKQLHFSNTLIMEGSVQNISKKKFSTCKVYFGFFRWSKNKYKQMINEIVPYKRYTHTLNQPLLKNEIADFRVVVDNYRLQNDINISAKSECY